MRQCVVELLGEPARAIQIRDQVEVFLRVRRIRREFDVEIGL